MCTATAGYRHLSTRVRIGLVLLVAVSAWTPGRATAAEMAWPLERAAECLVSFGANYPSGNGSATHRGVDLAAESESAVLAPEAATVSFAGTIPGVGGGTVTAVTLTTGDGFSITLLPLAGVSVHRGDSVGAGSVIGAVAAAGDGSVAVTHLHVGVRRGDVYLDPATMLTMPGVAADDSQGTPEDALATTDHTVLSPASASAAHASAASVAVADGSGHADQSSTDGARQTRPSLNTATSATTADAASEPVGLGDSSSVGSLVPSGDVAGGAEDAGLSRDLAADPVARAPISASQPAAVVHSSGASAAAARAAQIASRVAGSLGATWTAALLGTLVGLAALWPVMRRHEQVKEQPEVGIAPGGSDVAAAVGGC